MVQNNITVWCLIDCGDVGIYVLCDRLLKYL